MKEEKRISQVCLYLIPGGVYSEEESMRAFGVPVAVVLVAIFSAILPAPVVALDNLITLTGQWVDDRGNDNYFLHVNGNTIKIVLCPECQTQISFEGEIYENHFYGKYIESVPCVRRQPNTLVYSAEGPVSADGRTITLRYHMPITEQHGCEAIYAKGSMEFTTTFRKKYR